MSSLHEIRQGAVRLERYCRRAKLKIWSGNRDDLFNALADTAEVGEIARRLYLQLQLHTAPTASLQDEALDS